MTPDHCAGLLREADQDRFASVTAAQPGDRARLATLYAANLEIARAGLASAEPLISEMRLQFWADQIAGMAAGHAPTRHEVATPLFDAWGTRIAALAPLVEARRRDAHRRPFAAADEVISYIDQSAGTVMALAVEGCGGGADATLIRDQARGAGLASWLAAYPALRSVHLGLERDPAEALAALAEVGLDGLDSARRAPSPPRRVAAALYAGAGARRHLSAALAGKSAEIPAFAANMSRLRLAFFGHWAG